MTIHAKFDNDIYLPEDAEFYFVYDGSLKRHVMFAERVSDNALRSIVPGECSCSHSLSFCYALPPFQSWTRLDNLVQLCFMAL